MTRRVVVRETGSETMLYDPERDELHVLNAAAQLIYRLSREGRGIAEIEAALRSRFRIPPGRELRADIEACLEALRERGL